MRITLTRDEMLKVYEAVKNSNSPEAVKVFNNIFGKDHHRLIDLRGDSEGSTIVEIDPQIALPVLDILSKNAYSANQILSSGRNPLFILPKLKLLVEKLGKDILNTFK